MHQNKHQNTYKQHVPVLLNEVLQYLDPQPGESYLDLTAGYGGHARAILERTGSLTPSTLVDRDQNAICRQFDVTHHKIVVTKSRATLKIHGQYSIKSTLT